MSKFTTYILGDISEYITSGSRDWSKYYSDTGALFIRTQDINKNRLDTSSSARVALPDKVEGKRTRLKKGDLLVTITGANVGKCAVVDWDIEEAYVSQSVALIRLKCPDSAKFIYHQLTCKDGDQTYLEKAAYGLGRPVLNLTNMREVPIVLASSNIQKDIVSEIEKQFSRMDEAVASLKRIQANLKRYKAAVLKAAVEGKITEQWRKDHPDVEPADQLLKRILAERRAKWEAEELAKMKGKGTKPKDDSWKKKYKEPVGPDTANLPELPEGWVWATLSQLGELNRGKSKHRPRNAPHLYGGPYPFVQTGDIRAANGLLRKYTQTYSEAGLEQSRLWPAGTLCITIAANIADTAILGLEACFPDSIVGFVTDQKLCEIRFMEFFIRTAKENIERYAPATAQKNINLEILSDVAAPLPPLREQIAILDEIDRCLSVTEELQTTIETNLKRAERLRQTILQRAFSGGLA